MEDKDHRAKHGLYRALIANMIEGVSVGHTKKLEFRGVGYRAAAIGQSLDISVGYSHNIIFDIQGMNTTYDLFFVFELII